MSIQTLSEYLRGKKCKGFNPLPRYNIDGDFIEWYWEDVSCYAESIHAIINGEEKWVGSVMKAMNDNRPVGVKIYNIGYMMFINDGTSLLSSNKENGGSGDIKSINQKD